ncbi:helix-turn-helix domain-containing protein [Paraburkholderia phosphatilytica]|uniref:helix-turn-helix domain-containing protein n=1 Tax=Paraburkholderia phosphatilytica TaxID=2282883 RepID=UPI000E4C740A|nr:helix-turn-helix transcriptional regulator [Paraburkholderia phosphatilytica]
MTHVLITSNQLGQLLRSARRSRQLSQLEAATRIGLSQSRMSELELDAASITAAQLLALTALYGIELLLQEKGDMQSFDQEW